MYLSRHDTCALYYYTFMQLESHFTTVNSHVLSMFRVSNNSMPCDQSPPARIVALAEVCSSLSIPIECVATVQCSMQQCSMWTQSGLEWLYTYTF